MGAGLPAIEFCIHQGRVAETIFIRLDVMVIDFLLVADFRGFKAAALCQPDSGVIVAKKDHVRKDCEEPCRCPWRIPLI